MTNQRIEKQIQESERMLERLQKEPKLKLIYKDVNFRQIIEDGKAELIYRKRGFTELTPEEEKRVEAIFS